MPPSSRVKLFQVLVIVGLSVLFGLCLAVLIWLSIIESNLMWLISLGVGVLFLFAILLWLQHKLNNWIGHMLAQINYLQENSFSALYERSPVAHLIIDDKGTIIDSNPAGVLLLESSVDTIKEQNLFSIISTEDNGDKLSILMGKVAGGVTVNDLELPIKTEKGNKIWSLVSVTNYQNGSGRLAVLVDITEKKQIDTAKSEFVALATHQLRTPVSAIRWNAELLRNKLKGLDSVDWQRYLEKVERNTRRMNLLIDDFLSVSKLEMGTFATKIETITLTDFIDAILDEYSEKITEKNLVIKKQADPTDLVLNSDPALLHIIISNLISNSVKYLRPEGELFIEYQQLGNELKIIIADNGIGIPQSEVERLFSKFFRASNAQSHHTEGTGLGLYVVKQSVELLGGIITVESDENMGAKFTILLPL
jgi:PAS domain S-box-containing protein